MLKAKIGSFDQTKKDKILKQLDQIVEKPALVKFVSNYVKVSEVEKLLAVPESSSHPPKEKEHKPIKKSSSSTATTNNRSNHAYPTNNANMPTPSPEQLLQQASMMRKNPDLVRRSNPALAHFTNQQIEEYAKQLELVGLIFE